jgi:hypothetical protein
LIKHKKIRGQKRLRKKIESWRESSLYPNMEMIKKNHYDYVKVWVSPYNNLRFKERDYTGPTTKNRRLILSALMDIYYSWDLELKKMNIPYYLRIWLYEPRITSSQVVCGIDDRIEHYENAFPWAANKIGFTPDRYKDLANRIDEFNWIKAVDEEIIENDFWPKDQYKTEGDYFFDQRMFKKLEKLEIRKKNLSDETKKLMRYYVPKGHIWIGNKI